ncbi:MAG: MFS transporter [Dehalococcoidales bacterium]|nr:MFS transporter [Dehalococcoidales bacterium]
MKNRLDTEPADSANADIPAAGKAGFSFRHIRTFASFGNPVYRMYYGGMMGQMAAMNMQNLARSLLIYRLTSSAAILGIMSFANAIPMLICSLFGGVIADRVPKRNVLMAGQAASAIVSLLVAIALHTGYMSTDNSESWWILILTSILQGATMGLMQPSRQAIISEIVTEDELMNAISLNAMGMNTMQIFAPAVTGFLIDGLGFDAVYYGMTGMYLLAVVFFFILPKTGVSPTQRTSAIENIRAGLSYVRNEKTVLMVLLFSLIVVFLSMPYGTLLPIFTEDILKVGASGMGILLSVTGIGSIAGSVVLASLPNKKRGLMLLGSGIILGLALLVFSFSKSWPLSLALIVFVGLGQTGRMTLSNTLLQYYVDKMYMGRVMSIYMMQFGITSFGTFVAGMIAEAVGTPWALGSFAMLLLIASVSAFFFLPRLRKMD